MRCSRRQFPRRSKIFKRCGKGCDENWGTLGNRAHWLFIASEWGMYGSTATASARVDWPVYSWQFQLSVWVKFVIIFGYNFGCDIYSARISDDDGCNANVYAACRS